MFGLLAECLETGMMLSTKPTTPYLRDGMAGSRMLQAIHELVAMGHAELALFALLTESKTRFGVG